MNNPQNYLSTTQIDSGKTSQKEVSQLSNMIGRFNCFNNCVVLINLILRCLIIIKYNY